MNLSAKMRRHVKEDPMWKHVRGYGHERSNDMETAQTNQLPHTKTGCMVANACDEDMECALAEQCVSDVASDHNETV